MLKIMLPMMMTMFLSKNFNMNMLILNMILLIILSTQLKFTMLILNKFNFLDNLSMIMIMLSLMSTILIMLSTLLYNKTFKTIIPISIMLMMTFYSSNMMMFYIMFEFILIPTFILITSLGKQPERLQAGIYMMIYTIVGSLPLLLGIISMKYFTFPYMMLLMLNIKIPMIFMLAFLMKLPMFFMHLWLPKAHVEAPVEGSMILAAVLLKLGGYGMIRFLPLLLNKLNKFNFWFISISLMGAMSTSMNCIRQKDLKSLVAYSSVAHMGLILTSLMTMNQIGVKGAIIMMIGHGLSSSALFLLVNILYTKMHTRNIMMFKGLLKMFPNMTFWWFMFIAVNISAPPTINLMSEILMIMSMINWSMITMIILFLSSTMTAIFSINLYVNITHNTPNLIHSSQMNHKMLMSMMIHLLPLILLIMKMEIMI